MMRDTPRTFVGSVVFLLDGPFGGPVAEAVEERVGRLPGISHCRLDRVAGALLVTARAPVDRTEVVAVLDRLGLHVRG